MKTELILLVWVVMVAVTEAVVKERDREGEGEEVVDGMVEFEDWATMLGRRAKGPMRKRDHMGGVRRPCGEKTARKREMGRWI